MQVSSRALLRTKQFFLSLLSRKKGSSLNQTFMRRRDGRVMLLFLCLGLFSFMAFLFCIPMSQNKINFFKTFKTSSPTSRILFVFGTSHEVEASQFFFHFLLCVYLVGKACANNT